MNAMTAPLTILHVLRAPVGGLFRHVRDLASGQAARGHKVGVVADTAGGGRADAALADLAKVLALGLTRMTMSRDIGSGDFAAIRHVGERAMAQGIQVLHGHGAKGGAFARLAKRPPHAVRVYTPHGGSLHYRWGTPAGFVYLSAENILRRRTDLFLFESYYGRDTFAAKIGDPAATALVKVVHNGVADAEFLPVITAPDAADLVFVGELRKLKGVDVLIEAMARLASRGQQLTATIVGDGADRGAFERAAAAQNLRAAVRFVGAMPARAAFALGRALVVPSRAESLPYVVLEAAAAGIPIIATRVGGIPEIFGPDANELVPPGDPVALADAIAHAMQDRGGRHSASLRLKSRLRAAFSVDVMTDAVIDGYREALARKSPAPHG
ncbi:MAG: glycosyltransferase family 4 protein [Xanthobacteraceae bacterium]|nr:glycosyltransferase family 4 protein [Xanthobacteraceae bacterium]